VPGVLLGYFDLYFHTGVYLHNLSGDLTKLGAGLALVAVLGVGLAFLRVPVGRLPQVRRIVAWLAVVGGALVAVGLVVLITRPWWYVGHINYDNGLVAAIQQREGLPVDGTRLYTEDSVEWLSWYYSWPAVAAGFAGLIAWLVVGTRTRATQLLWLCALFLPSTVLYLTSPNITPDQIWAMRRFLPVVVPGLLLAATWVARELAARGVFRRVPVGRLVAGVLVFIIVAWPVVSMRHMWTAKDKAGALLGNERVCEQIDHRPTIVTGIDTYLPTVLVLCDVPAVSVPEPTPAKLAEAREALGGGAVVLATRAPGAVPWVEGSPPPQLTYGQELWEASLAGPPDEQIHQDIGVTLGRVLPDGEVEPLD
jgi:hypothetical protein